MEIRNEEHAHEMLRQWEKIPLTARKREIRLAIEHLELNSMYYEQKGNDAGVQRVARCLLVLTEHLGLLDDE